MKQQKPCVICGKPFFYRSVEGRVTCSPDCVAQRRKNIESRKEQRTCVVCGKLFSCLPSRKRVTCSPECAAQRRKNIESRKEQRTCVVCGKLFYCLPPRPKATCSHECAAQRLKNIKAKNQKPCAICGKLFYCSPSHVEKVTCSPKCSRQNCQKNMKAGIYAAASQRAAKARNDLPYLGRTEENIHAKRWVIQAPNGQIYECRNLRHWCREHADLIDGTPMQASSGFVNIKRTLKNKLKNGAYQWKGWRLLSWED